MIQVIGKVPLYSTEIRRFVKWLNRAYPINEQIRLVCLADQVLTQEILDEYKCGWDEIDETFGVYDGETGTILVACGLLDVSVILSTIAHESCHAIQHIEGRRTGEQEASAFGFRAMIDYEAG